MNGTQERIAKIAQEVIDEKLGDDVPDYWPNTAEWAAVIAHRLLREGAKLLPCDGGCNLNDGPEETCSRDGRPVAEVWRIAGAAIDRANAADRVVRALRAEIHHAADNGHVLDRASQGVGPGELVPAVRVSSIEAALEGFEVQP